MFFRASIAGRGWLVLMMALLMTACKPEDSDGDGVADEKDKCPTVAAKTKDGCPVEREIKSVHFYLETSGSMGGYFKRDAEFPTIISDLTAKIDKNIRPIDIYFIAETKRKFAGNAQAFSAEIAATKIEAQKSSQLHKIIGEIAGALDSNAIALLASDCILSFTDAEIKANPEINRDKAQSTLRSYMYATFADLNKRGIGASIYAFRSKFYGTYYDYRNGKKTLPGVERPFYVWVIADKELLTKFNAQLAGISSFKPVEELHFGLSDNAVTDFRIIPGISRKGDWMENGERDGIEEVGDPKKNLTQFAVALDLAALPPYAQDVAYLKDNLRLTPKGCAATFTVMKKEDADQKNVRSEPQRAALEESTHVLLIQVTDLALKEATIGVKLPLRYDTWYTAWSCTDDRNLAATCAGKTFALEHLIAGVRDAYETKNSDYINFTLNIEK